MSARASFDCQNCGKELLVGIIHVHCGECSVLMYEGDATTYSEDVAGTIRDNHPLPLCEFITQFEQEMKRKWLT